MRPSKVYILGYAGEAFGAAFFTAGYPLFLWHFLADQNVLSLGLISVALSCAFVFEGVAEILSSFAADRWGLSRRRVFLIGFFLRFAAFPILATFQLWVGSTGTTMVALLVAMACNSAGYAFFSGTFDGWAVTAEIAEDRHFSKSKFFVRAQLFERLLYFCGVSILIAAVFFMETVADIAAKEWLWTSIWIFAAVSQVTLWTTVFLVSKGYDSVQTGPKLPPMKVMVKNAFQPASLVGLTLLVCLYAVTMLVTFSWPLIAEFAGPRPQSYLMLPGLILFGFFGTLFARRCARNSAKQSSKRHAIYGSAAASGILILAGLLLVLMQPFELSVGVLVVCLVVVMRFFFFYGYGFVVSLIHEDIGADENVRACIVSIRMALANLVVGAIFLLHRYFYDSVHVGSERLLGWTILVVSLMAFLASLTMKFRK